MSKNKYIAFSSVLLSTMLLLSGCGDNSGDAEHNVEDMDGGVEVAREGFPIVEEEITMTMMGPGTGVAEWEDMPMLQEYAEMTNLNFQYTTPPISDFGTRFNLAFASGELPDVIFGVGPDVLNASSEVDYGTQGMLLPLEELIEEYAPNLTTLLEERPDIRQSITTMDGHIYSLPQVSDEDNAAWVTAPMWINGLWMEELGIEEVPETLDEMYEMLVRFRDEDPNGTGEDDTIPLSEVQMDRVRTWFLPAFGIKQWGIEENNGEVRYSPITEEYRAYLEFMHELYAEELMDQEIFSQSNEQKQAKGENNRLGVFSDFRSGFVTGQSDSESLINPMLGPLTSEWQEEPLMPLSQGINRGAFAITQENPNPAASVRWVDYFYSEEGYEMLNRGPAGYLWDWEDEEGGDTILNPDLGIELHEVEDVRGEITPDFGLATPGRRVSLPPIGGEEQEFDRFIREETQEKIEPHGEIPYPLVYLSSEEQEVVSAVEADLITYVHNSEAQFITGQLDIHDDDAWDNYVSTIENMNLDEFVGVHQDAYDRWEEAEE